MRVDHIEIHAGSVDFQFEPIRRLEAKCEARTNFSKTPTIADANAKLQELAAGLGANAVINVAYDSGMSLTSWRSLKATGLAVRKVSDEVACARCAEMIKRAAKVCRFCGAETSAATLSEVATTPSSSARPGRPVSPSAHRVLTEVPLRATDNSQIGILLVILVVVLLTFLGALGS